MGTGATMILVNQTNGNLASSLSDVKCMYQDGQDGSHLEYFDGLQLEPVSESRTQYIEDDGNLFSGCALSQSCFTINFLNQSIAINLGSGKFATEVTANSDAAVAQAMLAPNMPFESGPSYQFSIFGGPGICADLINSVLNANIDALVAAVKAETVTFPLSDSIQVTVDGFTSAMTCTYAALTTATPGASDATAIMNGDLAVSGTLSAESQNVPFTLSFNGLSALIRARLDLTARPASLVLNQLQLALLDEIDISSELLSLLELIFPVLRAAFFFATGPNIAGLVNAKAVPRILTILNEKIANLLANAHL